MPVKLTEEIIRKLEWEGKPSLIRDARLPGFLVAVNKTCKSYKIQADLWQGVRGRKKLIRTVRHTIGTTDQFSLVEARSSASDILSMIRRGNDPFPPKGKDALKNLGTSDPVNWTVDEMMNEYAADLISRDCAPRTLANIAEVQARYLYHWDGLPALSIKKKDARDLHALISKAHGKISANHALRYFRAAFNFAEVLSDDEEAFTANPVKGVRFHKERSSNRVLLPDELPTWWEDIQQIGNPIRREMHLLNLLSGLRPGTLMKIEKDWVDLPQRAIKFPIMKSGRGFHLPLSEQMVTSVERSLEVGDTLYPSSPWLFSTRKSKTREITHVMVIHEKSMPSQTGHICRHTHRTIAQRERIDKTNAMLLLDHKVPGISGVYIHDKALFEPLLEDQQRISNAICRLFERRKGDGNVVPLIVKRP
ncbi:tyrosine-type recombinase/integrase [Phaeovulum sp.]|uniref:tyrosine-type recombinase/integrase n=1 Tax=Phaeovulum sp. TaxID=2934796 RepID=UPI0039E67994